jgi:hypothetical protein
LAAARAGGRRWLFEPINRFAQAHADWAGYDLGPLDAIGAKLRAVYEAPQPRESDPMFDFDERELVPHRVPARPPQRAYFRCVGPEAMTPPRKSSSD